MSPVAKASLFVGEVLASWVLLTTDLYLYWIFLCQNFLFLLLFFSKKGQTLPEHKSWPSSGSRHWALEHCSTWLCAKNLGQRPLQWNLAAVCLKPCAGSDPGKWEKNGTLHLFRVQNGIGEENMNSHLIIWQYVITLWNPRQQAVSTKATNCHYLSQILRMVQHTCFWRKAAVSAEWLFPWLSGGSRPQLLFITVSKCQCHSQTADLFTLNSLFIFLHWEFDCNSKNTLQFEGTSPHSTSESSSNTN